MNLYTIEKSINELIEKGISINEETGEFFEFEDLEKLKINRVEKIENIAFFIKNLNNLEEGLKKEIKTLQERKKSIENKKERLKEYLTSFLYEKFETSKVLINFRKSEKLIIEDESEIPEEFFKAKITTNIDKMALKKAIKNGLNIKNVAVVEKRNINIK